MAKIEYVGQKPRKEDNVARTGIVWYGHGDVQEVPEPAFYALLKFPDVWKLAHQDGGLASLPPQAPTPPAAPAPQADGAPAADAAAPIAQEQQADSAKSDGAKTDGAQSPAPPAGPTYVLDGPDGELVLDTMDDDALMALSERLATETEGRIKRVDGRTKGDKRRAAIIDAVKAASAEA